MNLKSLPPRVRALVEAITDPAMDEKYEIIEVEENDDTVIMTFSRDVSFDGGEDGEDDDEE